MRLAVTKYEHLRSLFHRRCLTASPLTTVLAWLSGLLLASSAAAQTLTVPQMLEQQALWSQWAEDGTKLQLDGRYEGRTGPHFSMARLPGITFQPPRNNPLPERLRSGQRIEVSGRLRVTASRLVFEINRLTIGETDVARLQARIAQLNAEQIPQRYQTASEYLAIAEFYQDAPLQAEVQAVRQATFQLERRQLAGNPVELWQLADRGQELQLDPRLLAEVRFESWLARWQAARPDAAALAAALQQHAPGWDQPQPNWNDQQEAAYRSLPLAAYQAASDTERVQLHRRLFRAVHLQQLQSTLKPDGSNGIAVAAEIRRALPEESAAAAELEEREIRYRLQRVPQLSRVELQQLTDILAAHQRGEETAATVDTWLQAQERRFAATGLEGQIRTADEYLFAGDRWQRPEHQERGVSLLKQAWELASRESPPDAAEIADRLKRLGWERLKDRWMTATDIAALPGDDVQLAMREGRVVKGMTGAQVVGTLGRPARIARVVSARSVREFWIYDAPGSAGVVVQMQRGRHESTQDARVAEVTGAASRP